MIGDTTVSINGGPEHPIDLDNIEGASRTLADAYDEAGGTLLGDSADYSQHAEIPPEGVAEEHEIARAEDDGMPPPRTTKQQIEDAERAQQIEEAIVEVCSYQEQLDTAKGAESKAILAKKDASHRVEALTTDLSDASRRLRKLREGRFPDGDKYPMFDSKADINAAFPKPEAIAPLPPDTVEEAVRRKLESTPIGEMSLTKKVGTRKALEDLGLGLDTAGKVKRHFDSIEGAWDRPGAVKGMTEKRLEELSDAIAALATEATAEFQGLAVVADAPEEEGSSEE